MTDEKKKPDSESQKKLLKRVIERTNLMVDADLDNRNEARIDLRFLNLPGYQWDEKVKKTRGSRPCYEFNKTKIKVKRIVNEMRANRPAGKVRATKDASKETADVMEGLMRNIANISDLDTITDYAAEYQVGGGIGAWRVESRWTEDDSFEQDLIISAIPDPFNLYWDPASRDPMHRDAEDWSLLSRMTKSAFEAKYGKRSMVNFESDGSPDTKDWDDKETVRVCEYWYKEPYEKELWLLITGETIDASSPEAALITDSQVKRKRTAQCHKIMMCIAAGDSILEGPEEQPGRYHRFVVVHGEWFIDEGKPYWHGLTRNMKDAQRKYNVVATAVTESIASAPNSHFWATAKQALGNTDTWGRAINENLPYLLYNADPSAPGPPTRMGGPETPVALIQEQQIADQELKDVSGVYDAALGERSNEKSGVAITRREQQTQIVNFNYPDNMSKAIKLTWDIGIDLVPFYFDTERTIRVLGHDGAEDYVKINTVGVDEKTGQPVMKNDLTRGKYDVTVTVGPSFATQRLEASESYTQLASAFPQIMGIAGDLIFKSMDLPYADDIAERMQSILPPPIQQSLGKGKDIPPEVQQVMAQAHQAMQLVQQQSQLVQQAAAEADQKKGDVEKAIADLNVKRAQFDADVSKSLAQITMKEAAFTLTQAQAEAGASEDAVNSAQESLKADSQGAIAQIQEQANQYLQQALQTIAHIQASSQPNIIVPEQKQRPKIARIRRVNGDLIPEYEADTPPQTLTDTVQ